MTLRQKPLTLPTDRDILLQIQDRKRYTPKLLSLLTNHDPAYISARLRELETRGYVHDPISEYSVDTDDERSRMYCLTDAGSIATYHIEQYGRDQHERFDSAVRSVARNAQTPLYPDLIRLTEHSQQALRDLHHIDGVTIADALPSHSNGDFSENQAAQSLYTLYFHRLADRPHADVYRINDRGENILENISSNENASIDWRKITEQTRGLYSSDECDRLRSLIKPNPDLSGCNDCAN